MHPARDIHLLVVIRAPRLHARVVEEDQSARCAFATLWFVNDQSSASLVSDFYTQLRDHPERSKAKALQAAQIKLLADPRYAHPCYWAPYLIIGNWL